MKSILASLVALIGIALLSKAQGQEKCSIDARITGWVIHIDYSDIDHLPPGAKPVSRVRISNPSNHLRARMEAPFESFFALWDQLDSMSDIEAARTPTELPAGKDGIVLNEGEHSFKPVTSDTAVLLLRFWLDVFKHQWVEETSALTDKEIKLNGAFAYLLRHSPFPAEGNSLAEFTKKINSDQQGADKPASTPEIEKPKPGLKERPR